MEQIFLLCTPLKIEKLHLTNQYTEAYQFRNYQSYKCVKNIFVKYKLFLEKTTYKVILGIEVYLRLVFRGMIGLRIWKILQEKNDRFVSAIWSIILIHITQQMKKLSVFSKEKAHV